VISSFPNSTQAIYHITKNVVNKSMKTMSKQATAGVYIHDEYVVYSDKVKYRTLD